MNETKNCTVKDTKEGKGRKEITGCKKKRSSAKN
jgi:hypothetical protein